MRILLAEHGNSPNAGVFPIDSVRLSTQDDNEGPVGILQVWTEGEEIALKYWFDMKRLDANTAELESLMALGFGRFEVDGGYGW